MDCVSVMEWSVTNFSFKQMDKHVELQLTICSHLFSYRGANTLLKVHWHTDVNRVQAPPVLPLLPLYVHLICSYSVIISISFHLESKHYICTYSIVSHFGAVMLVEAKLHLLHLHRLRTLSWTLEGIECPVVLTWLAISVTRSALPPPCRLDAKKLTSALSALEELDLELNASSGDAVEKVLFIPTLKKLDLTVVSDHAL